MRNIGKRLLGLLPAKEWFEEDPYAVMHLQTYLKMCAYVDLVDTEINGLGSVERRGNVFYINDIFLVKQYTKAKWHVSFDDADFNRIVQDIVRRGGTPNLSFQWHSHYRGLVFFSREDIDTVRGYMDTYMISLVTNQFRDYVCRLDIFEPAAVSLDIPLFIIVPGISESVLEQCKEDIRQKVFKGRILKQRIRPANDVGSVLVPVEEIERSSLDDRRISPVPLFDDEDDDAPEGGFGPDERKFPENLTDDMLRLHDSGAGSHLNLDLSGLETDGSDNTLDDDLDLVLDLPPGHAPGEDFDFDLGDGDDIDLLGGEEDCEDIDLSEIERMIDDLDDRDNNEEGKRS